MHRTILSTMYLLHILESFEAICCILFVPNLFLICSWSPFLEKIQGSTRPAIHSSQENFRVQCEYCILFRHVQFYGEETTSFFADYWLLLFWVMAIDIPFNLILFIWLANLVAFRKSWAQGKVLPREKFYPEKKSTPHTGRI